LALKGSPGRSRGKQGASLALEFAKRVLRCASLSGFEVAAFWPANGNSLELRARHAYGPWRGVKVKIIGVAAESESGSVLFPSDVARRLRHALGDRMLDRRQMRPDET
jgi:hypothetical protein